MANLTLFGGPCYEYQWISNPDTSQPGWQSLILHPDNGEMVLTEVPCPDGGGIGWTDTGGSGAGGGGGSIGSGTLGSSGNPNQPPSPCDDGNVYQIPTDKTCLCCNDIIIALDDLETRLHIGGNLFTKLFSLFTCGTKKNTFLVPLLNCLTGQEWNKTVKNISCDKDVIQDMSKGGGVAHFQAFSQKIRNVQYNANTMYVNCTQAGPNLESILFHEFVHACEQSIFKFTQADIDNGKNSELDAYILQQFLFPNTPPPPGPGSTLYQKIQDASGLISGGLGDPHVLYGQFFAFDEDSHQFFARTTKGVAHLISTCGEDTSAFKDVVKYTGGQNPSIIYHGGSGLSTFGNYPDQNALINNNNVTVLTGFNQVSNALKNRLSLF